MKKISVFVVSMMLWTVSFSCVDLSSKHLLSVYETELISQDTLTSENSLSTELAGLLLTSLSTVDLPFTTQLTFQPPMAHASKYFLLAVFYQSNNF